MEDIDSLKFKKKIALFPGSNSEEQYNALSQNENLLYYLLDAMLLYILVLSNGCQKMEVGSQSMKPITSNQ